MYDFAQSDLDEEDVMLLDTWAEVRDHMRTQQEDLFLKEYPDFFF